MKGDWKRIVCTNVFMLINVEARLREDGASLYCAVYFLYMPELVLKS